MAYEDDDDLFGEDFDFVDEDEEESAAPAETGDQPEEPEEPEEAAPARAKQKSSSRGGKRAKKARGGADAKEDAKKEIPDDAEATGDDSEQPAPEPEEPPGPPADHVVHVYEFGKFKRTIKREFTSEDAEAFAVEYNRTSQTHGREALAANRDEEPLPVV